MGQTSPHPPMRSRQRHAIQSCVAAPMLLCLPDREQRCRVVIGASKMGPPVSIHGPFFLARASSTSWLAKYRIRASAFQFYSLVASAGRQVRSTFPLFFSVLRAVCILPDPSLWALLFYRRSRKKLVQTCIILMLWSLLVPFLLLQIAVL